MLFSAGYGYEKFAHNIKKQDWCSPKQELAMKKMEEEITLYKNNYRKRSKNRSYYYSHDDSYDWFDEHYDFGDFF